MRLVQGLAFIFATAGMAGVPAAHAETRGFVVAQFFPAFHSQEGDCAGGLNLNTGDQYDISLVASGYDERQVAEWARKAEDKALITNFRDERHRAIRDRATINGKKVSAWVNPQATPDPNLNMVTSRFALGFDLDGKTGPASFENPMTGETGVDNQYFRALGCFTAHRGTYAARPATWSYMWDIVAPAMPAWLMSVTADDFKNGPAIVSFYRAREHIERDVNNNVLPDLTFRIDPDLRSQISFKGEIHDGVVSITEHGDLHAVWGEMVLLTDLRLSNTHLRLSLRDDGTADGVLGGYQPWKDTISDGYRSAMGADSLGEYWNIRKLADANPDPKTGMNQDISVAYRINAVPAFLIPPP